MAGVQWAAELRDRLRASGTGKGKIDAVSEAMAERFDHPANSGKPEDHPDRHLTAAEALDVLRKIGAGEYTIGKAKQLLETGLIKPVEQSVGRGERLPPPPRITAPVRPVTAEGRESPVSIAGVEERTIGDGDVIGPKAVTGKPETASDKPKKPTTVKRGGKKAKEAETEPTTQPETEEVTSDADSSGVSGDSPGPGGTATE